MLGEHLGQGGFTATDISCYNDVHGSVGIGCFTIYKDSHITWHGKPLSHESY
jgi:hypothetical protein